MIFFSEGKYSALSFLFVLYLNTSTSIPLGGLTQVCIQTKTSAADSFEITAGFGNSEDKCKNRTATDPYNQYCNFALTDNRIFEFSSKKNFLVDVASEYTESWETRITYHLAGIGEKIPPRSICLVDQVVTCNMCGDVCVLPPFTFVGSIIRVPRVQSCPYTSDTNLTAAVKMPEFPENLRKLVVGRSRVNLQMEWDLKQGDSIKQRVFFNITLWKRDFTCGP